MNNQGNCLLCGSVNIKVRHINLYIIGSEGLWACHPCEMKVVEFVRSLMHENGRRKLEAAKEAKRAPCRVCGVPGCRKGH